MYVCTGCHLGKNSVVVRTYQVPLHVIVCCVEHPFRRVNGFLIGLIMSYLCRSHFAHLKRVPQRKSLVGSGARKTTTGSLRCHQFFVYPKRRVSRTLTHNHVKSTTRPQVLITFTHQLSGRSITLTVGLFDKVKKKKKEKPSRNRKLIDSEQRKRPTKEAKE